MKDCIETKYIEITFPGISCKKCGGTEQIAALRYNRYGIYCKNCGSYIKWADKGQTVLINAREQWLEGHKD